MSHLNVTQHGGDEELEKVKAKIEGEKPVDRRFDVETWLQTNLSGTHLDFVAHSTAADAVLQVGEWIFDTNALNGVESFCAHHKARLLAIGVKQVRLLGCLTASTTEGFATMQLMENAFGSEIAVIGTNATLDESDFLDEGFNDFARSGKLATTTTPIHSRAAWRASPWSPLAEPVGEIDLELAPPIHGAGLPPPWPVQEHPGLLDSATLRPLLSPVGRLVRGLLTTPSIEIRFRAHVTDARFRRLHVLFGGEMVRIYPSEAPGVPLPAAATYLVENVDALRNALSVRGKRISFRA